MTDPALDGPDVELAPWDPRLTFDTRQRCAEETCADGRNPCGDDDRYFFDTDRMQCYDRRIQHYHDPTIRALMAGGVVAALVAVGLAMWTHYSVYSKLSALKRHRHKAAPKPAPPFTAKLGSVAGVRYLCLSAALLVGIGLLGKDLYAFGTALDHKWDKGCHGRNLQLGNLGWHGTVGSLEMPFTHWVLADDAMRYEAEWGADAEDARLPVGVEDEPVQRIGYYRGYRPPPPSNPDAQTTHIYRLVSTAGHSRPPLHKKGVGGWYGTRFNEFAGSWRDPGFMLHFFGVAGVAIALVAIDLPIWRWHRRKPAFRNSVYRYPAPAWGLLLAVYAYLVVANMVKLSALRHDFAFYDDYRMREGQPRVYRRNGSAGCPLNGNN